MADLLHIRSATLEDAPVLATLSDVLGYPVAVPVFKERLRRLLASPSDAVVVAEHPQEHIVGWIHGSAQELLESGQRCEILGLVVATTARNRGVGRRLVAAIEAWAQSRGLIQIAVRSDVVRVESHPFYKRLGYGRVKTQHVYRKELG